jgi:hypothetical protein
MQESVQPNLSRHRFARQLLAVALFVAFLGVGLQVVEAQELQAERYPGLALGLRPQASEVALPLKPPPVTAATTRLVTSGDHEAGDGQGFSWYMVADYDPDNTCNVYWAPPAGVAVGLRHSAGNDGQGITMYGYEASSQSPPKICSLLTRMDGGGSGATAGEGFFWYENRGHDYYDPMEVAMSVLPRGTVFCLRHTANQNSGTLATCTLGGAEYSSIEAEERLQQARLSGDSRPVREILKESVPAGFDFLHAADPGAEGGDGYVWFEKVTGPEPWEP